MGYFTYRIFRGVLLDRLTEKTRANLTLYEPGTTGRDLSVRAVEGTGCSALEFGHGNREEALLMPLGYQFGCVWMDVACAGDWWELTVHEAAETRVWHNPNPWVHGGKVEFEQEHFNARVDVICRLWPEHAERMRPYLLPARLRVTKMGRTRFVRRIGKAHPSDRAEYGDADQIHDFVGTLGITEQSRSATVKAG